MKLRVCNVEMKQLPGKLSGKRLQLFWGELESCMKTERPCIVLDCSNLRQLNRSAIGLMLHCLEEAIKRNGDVKLTSVNDAGKATLELTGVGRLFEIFETNADALSSFDRLPAESALQISAPSEAYRNCEDV